MTIPISIMQWLGLKHAWSYNPKILLLNIFQIVRLELLQLGSKLLKCLADAHLNMTQGVLEGVVGDELGVLPGMDSIFSALALQRNVGFSGNVAQRNQQEDKFDVIVYDGISTEETIQMTGATSKARLYLKYFWNLAEKTDLGRLAGPSLLRLANEAISSSTRGSQLNGKMSAEIWDDLEQTLEGPIIDTVVMNPPFGTRKKGAVMDFLFATLKTRNATRLIALTIATSLGDLTHTLGTLVSVIGANGFATAAAAAPVIGTVVGSFR
ncbi:unnamed protein product [Camellia sinensis]